MVKLDYKAIVAAGEAHGACHRIDDIRDFADKGQYEHANALIANDIGWISRNILSEEYELFPEAFLDAMKLMLPYSRFAAMKALRVKHSMGLTNRWIDEDGIVSKRVVAYMFVMVDRRKFLVMTSQTGERGLCSIRASVWKAKSAKWSDDEDLPETIETKTLLDPKETREIFIKLIRKHKAEICAQLG